MPDSIKISFVVPVYNMESYVRQCLDSLCQQSLTDIEIICVDDGSADRSVDILEEYAQKDPRIRVFHNKEEGPGAAMARNMGLKQVRGDFVLVMDSDDYVDLRLAEKTYDKALETGADVVIFDVVKFDSQTGAKTATNQFFNPDLLPKQQIFSPIEVADRLFLLGDGVAWNKLIRYDLICRNNLEFFPVHVVDDMNFTFSALVCSKNIAILPEKLLFYRVNNGTSQMAHLYRDPLTPVKVLERLYSFLQEKKAFSLYEKTYIERGVGLCMFYFDGLTQESDFRQLYEYLHQGGLGELGFSNDNKQDSPKNQWMNAVKTLSVPAFKAYQQEKAKIFLEKGSLCGIYGFGVRTALVWEKITQLGGVVVAVADSSKEKEGEPFQDLKVLSPDAFGAIKMDKIIISTPNYYEEIKKKLLYLGFSEEKISLI